MWRTDSNIARPKSPSNESLTETESVDLNDSQDNVNESFSTEFSSEDENDFIQGGSLLLAQQIQQGHPIFMALPPLAPIQAPIAAPTPTIPPPG